MIPVSLRSRNIQRRFDSLELAREIDPASAECLALH